MGQLTDTFNKANACFINFVLLQQGAVQYEILEGVRNRHQPTWKEGHRLTFLSEGIGSKRDYWKFQDSRGGVGYLKPTQVEMVKEDESDAPAATSDEEDEEEMEQGTPEASPIRVMHIDQDENDEENNDSGGLINEEENSGVCGTGDT
ncbi:hypothetical protein CYMTET_17619 [Cymbomonas tetramitiformis]|uniref:Uncharacterized protein n=1 Tax=Cymbomonas tetramitiformis TaxID=36881 RepID=A0AAE0L6S5_9CHLO|nr:hypothetical protein CYMTET_17619 [Cymbomonas tetramitiformis]